MNANQGLNKTIWCAVTQSLSKRVPGLTRILRQAQYNRHTASLSRPLMSFAEPSKTLDRYLLENIIFISIILCAETTSFAQKIIRASLSSFGNVTHENGIIYRQTIGQPSNTSVFSNDETHLRQGFQQPVFPLNSGSSIEKECTIYLSPNPTADIVSIKFFEEIGENQISVFDMLGKLHFKVNSVVSFYEMDVSKLPKGIYLLNVVSKSGYHCNEKLIVL